MQAFICAVVRACTKFGIAMAANRPMMATTIMISTSVKPALREVLIFIVTFYLSFFVVGVNVVTGGFMIISVAVHELPVINRCASNSAKLVPRGNAGKR
jgi:hypothetical protein